MPVYGTDRDWVPESERLAIARVRVEMEGLGCEITSVRWSSIPVERWLVRWWVRDHRISESWGATGQTALAAVGAAVSNAQSDLNEAPRRWRGSVRGWARGRRQRFRRLATAGSVTEEEGLDEFDRV